MTVIMRTKSSDTRTNECNNSMKLFWVLLRQVEKKDEGIRVKAQYLLNIHCTIIADRYYRDFKKILEVQSYVYTVMFSIKRPSHSLNHIEQDLRGEVKV